MRKGKRSRPSVQAWLFALAIPAVALFMVFSLMPYKRMVGQWPLGIGQGEVMAFQELFDRRPGQHAEGGAPVMALREVRGDSVEAAFGEGASQWAKRSVLEHANGTSCIRLEFQEGAGPNGASRLELMAAGLHSLVDLYAQAVADSLPVLSAPLTLVRLQEEGSKPRPWLMQEGLTPDFVMKHAAAAMVLLGPDGQVRKEEGTTEGTIAGTGHGPSIVASRFDSLATASVGLLACAGQRKALLEGGAGAMYDRITGITAPIYGMAQGSTPAGSAMGKAFGEAFAVAAVQRQITGMAERLRRDSAAWAARLLRIDSTAVPVLANGRNIGLVQAEVDRQREAFLQRLFHPSPEQFIGPPVQMQRVPAAVLDPWLAQFRTQPDTLRFVRGKYTIDHDLVIPPGMAVVLEKGTRWFMAPGVSVVFNGELHARGTDLNPVFIRPLNDTARWGVLAVNGTGNTRVRLRGVRISGGGDKEVEGVFHGGMLSFLRADVAMDHCDIGESFGAAAVNAMRGGFRMADCTLADAHMGFVGLSETEGSIVRSTFLQPGRAGQEADRSALLLRSCRMQLAGCTFADLSFVALRLVHGSEATVANCRFTGNAVALLALDGSTARVNGSDFSGNQKVFVLRREHRALGGATVKEEGNVFTGNGTFKEVDAASKLEGSSVPVVVQ